VVVETQAPMMLSRKTEQLTRAVAQAVLDIPLSAQELVAMAAAVLSSSNT
jgi:hypothetical protein